MVLLQLILIVIGLCVIATAVISSLFSAPWYALAGVLMVAFVVTRWLMPELQAAIAADDLALTVSSQTDRPAPIPSEPADTPGLSYRGAAYGQEVEGEAQSAVAMITCSPLSYRGAKYATELSAEPNTQSLEVELHSASDRQPQLDCRAPEMKYRGVKLS